VKLLNAIVMECNVADIDPSKMCLVDVGAGVGMGAMWYTTIVRTVTGKYPKSFLGVEVNPARFGMLESYWKVFAKKAMVRVKFDNLCIQPVCTNPCVSFC
jgi:hypothetical protein